MKSLRVSETFCSVQGESTFAGLPCFFIRLLGCNLSCHYCDTAYARSTGEERRIADLVEEARTAGQPLVEITGGEPLLQEGTAALAAALLKAGMRRVLIESNGSIDISPVPSEAILILDVKCPGSGAGGSFDAANLDRLRAHDEVKFVLSDDADYVWAREFVRQHRLPERCGAVLFSPAAGRMDPAELARRLTMDRLPVRLQVQLHRVLGVR